VCGAVLSEHDYCDTWKDDTTTTLEPPRVVVPDDDDDDDYDDDDGDDDIGVVPIALNGRTSPWNTLAFYGTYLDWVFEPYRKDSTMIQPRLASKRWRRYRVVVTKIIRIAVYEKRNSCRYHPHTMGYSIVHLHMTLRDRYGTNKRLTYFGVQYNALTGTLSASIGQWTALTYFGVNNNAMTGTIPASIGSWSQIQ
jgi:hypothetical protein